MDASANRKESIDRRLQLVSIDVPDAGPLQVLVLARDPLVRTGLASYFSDTVQFELAGSHTFDDDLSLVLKAFQPDLVLWDVNGEIEQPSNFQPLVDAGVPIVALIPDEDNVEGALSAGARAILLRSVSRDLILTALFSVHRGLIVIDPDLAEFAFNLTPLKGDLADLTPREFEVLTLLAEGLPNKLIADRLEISEHTVKFHVASLLSKLGAQSRTEAVIIAARRGMLIV